MDELIQAELRRTYVRSETDELRSIIVQLQTTLQEVTSEQEKRIMQLQEVIDEQEKRIVALEGRSPKEEQERINALEIKTHDLEHFRNHSMNPMANRPYIPYTPAPWKSSIPFPAPLPTKYSGIRVKDISGFFGKK